MRRSQVNRLIRELGHEPSDVSSIEFAHDRIRVHYVERFDDDMRWVVKEFRHEYDESDSGRIKLRDLQAQREYES